MSTEKLLELHKLFTELYQKELINPLPNSAIEIVQRDIWNKLQKSQKIPERVVYALQE
jgi:hypothetical protein